MNRGTLLDLLQRYDATDPECDFEFLRKQFRSDFQSFSVLASSVSTCLPAFSLLLALDFSLVVADAKKNASDLLELERWIGFIPEKQVTAMRQGRQFNRLDWFKRFADASVEHACVPLIRKLLRLGHCQILAESPTQPWSAELFTSVIQQEPHAHLKDSLLLAFVSSNPEQARKFTNVDYDWVSRIVLNRSCLAPPALFKLLDVAAAYANAPSSIEFLEKMCLVWSDSAFVLKSSLTRHGQVSGVIRYCFAQLANVSLEEAGGKERITTVLLPGVQEHLSCNIPEKRLLGMIVAEEFTNIFLREEEDRTLDFGDDRSAFVDEYNPRLVPPRVVATTPNPAPVVMAVATAPTNVALANDYDDDELLPNSEAWPANPFSYKDDDDEEEEGKDEDDDICSLDPLDISEDTAGLVTAPKHLRDIPGLLFADSMESMQAGLENLPLIVRTNANRVDTRRRAAKLAFTLLELDNKFDMAQFETLRSKALVTLVVCVPKETGPALAKSIYSRNVTLGTKMVALECVAEAVKILADGGFLDKDAREEANALEHRPRMQQHVGTVTKRSAKLSLTKAKTRENILAPLAWQYFFTPLCSRLVNFEREPMLLCKVVAVLALILERSKHAGGEARRMAEDFCHVLPWLKFRTEGEIQRALLFALAAISSVALDLVSNGNWIPWLEYMAEQSQDDVARQMAQKIGPMIASGRNLWI